MSMSARLAKNARNSLDVFKRFEDSASIMDYLRADKGGFFDSLGTSSSPSNIEWLISNVLNHGCVEGSKLAYEYFISKQADKFLTGNSIKCSEGLMLEIKQAAIRKQLEI